MAYDFDRIITRKGSDSKKWNDTKEIFGKEDILPMWVADMDFKSADEITNALVERAEHGVFGYPFIQDSFYEAVVNWCKRRYGWEVKKEWILYTPGVVQGLNIGVLQLTDKGDKVVVQPPVYPPFLEVVENKGRIVNENPLVDDGEKFVMDYEGLESIIDEATKLIMICNPQNPVGRVWSEEELLRIGNICLEKNIPIISDEIHADFVFKGHKHTPLASLSKDLEDNTITLLAPSKTFNIAGLNTSVAIIPNENLRKKYEEAIEVMAIGGVNIFGALGLEVAYNKGENWLDEVLVYLEGNVKYAVDYIEKNIPKLKLYNPDGTYLLWLNFEELNRSSDEINEALLNIGKIGLNDGRPYGTGGDKHFRLNIGCPRDILTDGLGRIKKAVDYLK